MDFELTAIQDELRRSVRDVLARECSPTFVREVVEQGAPTDKLWRRMGALGWPGLAIAEEDGGLGLGFVEVTLVAEELGRSIAPGPFLATVTQFAPAIQAVGTPDQRARFLPAIAAGELTGSLAIAEPGRAGGHVRLGHDFSTRARRDGRDWILEGAKHWVMEATGVDELVIAAATDDGVGLFLVPRLAADITPLETLDPSRGYATVALGSVTVDGDRALGGGADCAEALEAVVLQATTAVAMETVGVCQRLFDMTLEYAKTREQFGVPIGSFQAVKHKLADCYVALERARSLCYFAAMTIAEDDPRRGAATAMAKAAAGDCQRLLCRESIQIHGGIGYTWEHDLHLFVKRAMTGDLVWGTAADHRARLTNL